MRVLNKLGLIEQLSYGWLMGIHTAVLRVAMQMNIPLIFYSEDGEVERSDAKYKIKAFMTLIIKFHDIWKEDIKKLLIKPKTWINESYTGLPSD